MAAGRSEAMRTREDCLALDRDDPFADRRALFELPGGVIYLDGNSLGPPPTAALARLDRTAREEWGEGLIRSWTEAGWMDLPLTLGRRLAPLIGAAPDEILSADTVTTLIFKLAGALVLRDGGAVACERGEFPTDGHVLEGLSSISGARFERVAPDTRPADLPADVRVLVKSAAHYKTAKLADIKGFEAEAKARGLSIIWDLSHAAGLVDLNLKRDGARFAVGCGYKFLNGGPGAPAFIYVDAGEIDTLEHPVPGWLGHARPFDFEDPYEPGEGIVRFRTSSPSILALSTLDAALSAYEGVDMAALHAKAIALGDLLLERGDALGLASPSPGIGERRGGHVCLQHPEGYAVVQALIARGVIGDFRDPDLMRFGFNPLYVSYTDVYDAGAALAEVIETEEWNRPAFIRRKAVT